MNIATLIRSRRAGGPAAFFYKAGGPSNGIGESFARASAALYQDAAGTWQSAAQNVKRDSHYIGGSRRTLIESQPSTNSALGSCLYADDTYWGGSAGFTLAAATSCIAGQVASRHTALTGAVRTRTQTVGTFVSGQSDTLSVIFENVDADTSVVTIYDTTASAILAEATLTWATHTAAITAGSGTCGVVSDGFGRYRLFVVGTGVAVNPAVAGGAGNARQIIITPTGNTDNTKSVILHHSQFVAPSTMKVPSSPVVTVAASVTRAADLWSFTWPRVPEAGTLYIAGTDMAGAIAATTVLTAIANSVGVNPRYRIYKLSTKWLVDLVMSAGSSSSAAASACVLGDYIELRSILTVTGTNVTATFGQAINSGSEAVAATGTSRALDAAYSTPTRFYIGANGDGSSPVNFAFQSILYVPGPATSLADMRALAGT